MGAAEVLSRFRECLRSRKLRLQYERNRCAQPNLPDFDPEGFSFCRSGTSCLPELKWDIRKILQYQEDLLQGLGGNLNHSWYWTQDKEVWHVAPDTGNRWPSRFSGRISYRPGNPIGDARVMWEPARLQHLVALGLLAKHGSEHLTQRAVEMLEEQVLSWVRENPFPTGIHYVSAMECGLRVLSLCYAFDFIRTHLTRPRNLWKVLLDLLHVHGTWIARNLSLHSSRGNHTVVEGTALMYLGILFPEFPEAAEWERLGRQLLEEEVHHLILQDGGSAEQAFGYHAFTIDCFELVAGLLNAYGRSLFSGLQDKVSVGKEFLRLCSDDQAVPIPVGDSDDGHALSPFLRLRKEELPAVCGISEMYQFPSSGYTVIRNEDPLPCHLLLDHGPLGLSPCFGHGHADALSVVFRCGSQKVLIDPGTFSYWDADLWRPYFRGTSAHNTVTVDKLDQAVQAGSFLWSEPYDAWSMVGEQCPNGRIKVLALHNGYQRRTGVVHWRAVLLYPPSTWIIWDLLRGTGAHHLELNWHCGVVPREDDDSWVFPIEREALRMRIQGGATSSHLGQTDPIAGWQSRQYGKREPIMTLRTAFEGNVPHEFCTWLTFASSFPNEADIEPDVRAFRERVYGLPTN